MLSDLKRLINVLKRNKENKCFILDEKGKIGYVLITLEEFERLSEKYLTDERNLTNINREIAYWNEKEKEKNTELHDLLDLYDEEENLYFQEIEEF